jgi:CheY-like chemotaxis protein
MQNPPRILLVDDEAIAAMSLRLSLRKIGYSECQIVGNGEKAIEMVAQGLTDVVIMDIHLTGKMDGLEAVRQMQVFSPTLPVIFITGYVDWEYQERANELHPAAYIVKPIAIHELNTVLENIVTG